MNADRYIAYADRYIAKSMYMYRCMQTKRERERFHLAVVIQTKGEI